MNQSVSLKFWQHKDEKELLQKFEEIGRNAYQSWPRTTDDSCFRFIEMIINKGHLGILEHEIITLEITTNRAIANELVRHRLASYVQESTRYVNYEKNDPEFITNIKGIYGEEVSSEEELINLDSAIEDFIGKKVFGFYQLLIRCGVKPEIARDFLPLGLKTTVYATMNIRNWFHFLALRSAPDAHPMMRELSEKIIDIFWDIIPFITEKMLTSTK